MENPLPMRVTGIFKFYDTHGLPLPYIAAKCKQHGLRIAVDVFVYDAVCSGWSFEKAIAALWEMWADTEGPRTASEISETLERGCKKRIAEGILKDWTVSEFGFIAA